jgi:hypothetical protein
MVYKVIDTLILILCLPFYAIFVPLLALYQWRRQRRPVHVGLELTDWPSPDNRVDTCVVDASRVSEGLVGVRRRRWNVLHTGPLAPPYPDAVEYITLKELWVPDPILKRRSKAAARPART